MISYKDGAVGGRAALLFPCAADPCISPNSLEACMAVNGRCSSLCRTDVTGSIGMKKYACSHGMI
jgi:hypothetical protein